MKLWRHLREKLQQQLEPSWKPEKNVFYMSWHNHENKEIVEAVVDKLRYPAAFMTYHACPAYPISPTLGPPDQPKIWVQILVGPGIFSFDKCLVWIMPSQYSCEGRGGKPPQEVLGRSIFFTVPLYLVMFKRKEKKETLSLEQENKTIPQNYRTVNYEVKIKEMPADVRTSFISWKNSLSEEHGP